MTYGGYLTKAGTVDGGHFELRALLSPREDLPRYIRDTTGYYTDEHGDETLQPMLALLPHGRMLAGWTMGEGMATDFDTSDVFTDERDAWIAAHHMAERDAEREREYQASLCAECFSNERRGSGELPDLCESCYADADARTLALHATV